MKNVDARTQKATVAMLGASEELTKTVSELRMILEKVNNGQGTAARLVNDGKFYENLLENTQQLQLLLEDLTSLIAKWDDDGVQIKLK